MLKIFLITSEKLFIIPYTHLDSQNSSDGVRFPFVRSSNFVRFDCQLSFHTTENFTSSSRQIRPQSSDTFQHSHWTDQDTFSIRIKSQLSH